jgi:hypothetical protein
VIKEVTVAAALDYEYPPETEPLTVLDAYDTKKSSTPTRIAITERCARIGQFWRAAAFHSWIARHALPSAALPAGRVDIWMKNSKCL